MWLAFSTTLGGRIGTEVPPSEDRVWETEQSRSPYLYLDQSRRRRDQPEEMRANNSGVDERTNLVTTVPNGRPEDLVGHRA